jgi:hypothetical protein
MNHAAAHVETRVNVHRTAEAVIIQYEKCKWYLHVAAIHGAYTDEITTCSQK